VDYNLNALNPRDFEHLSEALAQAILGPGVAAFGDGKDGGREATFEGRVPYPSELAPWEGYGVVQAKFRQRPELPPTPVTWLEGQIRKEFEAWLSPTSKRERPPQYLIFTTNVVLTPVPHTGGIAQIDRFISAFAERLHLKSWAVWHYDQLCRYLEQHDSIRRTYAHAVTAGDVLARLYDEIPSRSKSDTLAEAVRASRVRRQVRLSPVPDERVDAVLDWMDTSSEPVVEVPPGSVKVLVAPLGAGKSEQAERWLAEGLREAEADPEMAAPLWLDARRAVQDLQAAVVRETRDSARSPSRIVIDDLDGVSAQQAAQLLDDARVMVTTWPNTRVLATCRPGIAVTGVITHTLAPWPPQKGKELVDLVTGETTRLPLHEREVLDLLTSPLQALSVAARLLAGRDTRVSSLELLSGLATTVIQRKRPGRHGAQTWDGLARLAARLLDAGAPISAQSFGHEADVWDLTETGLVVNDGMGLRFALPVFEQHFGAQALRKGRVRIEDAAGLDAFPRWRYAIAFALNTAEPGEAEDLMLRLTRTNPAAASWTLDELDRSGPTRSLDLREAVLAAKTAMERLHRRQERNAYPTALLVGEWLREAMNAYVDGLGPLAHSLPELRDGRLPRWGVWAHEGHMAISPSRFSSEPPEVTPLLDHPRTSENPEWRFWKEQLFPREPLGRWAWARDRLREQLHLLVERGALSVPATSPLARERLWFFAEHLVAHPGGPPRAVIAVADLRDTVNRMMERVRASAFSTWHVGRFTIDSNDVRWLQDQLAEVTATVLHRPRPLPDQEAPRPGMAWQNYSSELTLKATREILQDAIVGYRHLVEANFPTFGSALGLYSALPVQAEGLVVMPEDDAEGNHSGLLYTLRPEAEAFRDAAPTVHLDLWTEPGFGPAGPFPAIPVDSTSNFHQPFFELREFVTADLRPATALAYEWLIRDLKAVGWIGGTVTFRR
jgi:hypothetical protein